MDRGFWRALALHPALPCRQLAADGKAAGSHHGTFPSHITCMAHGGKAGKGLPFTLNPSGAADGGAAEEEASPPRCKAYRCGLDPSTRILSWRLHRASASLCRHSVAGLLMRRTCQKSAKRRVIGFRQLSWSAQARAGHMGAGNPFNFALMHQGEIAHQCCPCLAAGEWCGRPASMQARSLLARAHVRCISCTRL